MKIKFDTLKNTDIYSLLLFILFKISDLPEYSSLSELAYVLDKDSLLKICSYFGGQTITIPTLDKLEILVKCLLLYQYTNIESYSLDNALSKLDIKKKEKEEVLKLYNQVIDVIKDYSFPARC